MNRLRVFGLLLVLGLVAGSAWGQAYTVLDATLDGGGGTATAGPFTLIASIGGTSPVGRSAAGPYVLYSGVPSPLAGRVAVLIVHTPEGTAEAGTAQALTARIVTSQAPLAEATLFYRSGQDEAATAVPMAPDGDGFVGTIPGAAVGAAGLTYYFTATDADGTAVRAPRRGVYSLPVMLADGVQSARSQPAGASQSAYRLVSMPIVLDDPRPEAVLGDDVPTLSSAAAYDPAVARFFEPIGTRVAEFPGTGDFELGRAFWLIVKEGMEGVDSGGGTALPLNRPAELELSRGWNFVGTPFTIPVPVDNVRTASGAPVQLRSYGEDGYNTPDTPVTELAPFSGYALFVPEATTLIVEPPGTEQGAGTATRRSPHGEAGTPYPWHLRIRATSRYGADADNVAAVHREAEEGWDAHDWPEPPAIGTGLRLSFEAAGAPEGVSLSTDVRPRLDRGSRWPLRVAADGAGPVTLSVEGMERVPTRYEAWLVDEETRTTWNLRTTTTARVTLLEGAPQRALSLVVGTRAYVQGTLRELDAHPTTYAFDAPYPNPSRGAVAFRIGVPEATPVTVAVYNLLGQRVAVLRDGERMAAGYHTIVWEAPRLASGVYFARMEAGNFRTTQKLVRVR